MADDQMNRVLNDIHALRETLDRVLRARATPDSGNPEPAREVQDRDLVAKLDEIQD